MENELSWKKELGLAEDYAVSGPNDVPENYMERCLKKAVEKAEIDISKDVERIRKIWKDQL